MRNRTTPPEPETARPGKQLAAILEGLEQEEPQKAERPRSIVAKRASGALLVVAALDLSAFLLGVAVLGRARGLELWYGIIGQVFAAALSLLLIKCMDSTYRIGLGFKGLKNGLVALLPLALATAAWMRPFNGAGGAELPILVTVGALTEATWEEVCFRGLGVFLLTREDGKLSHLAIVGNSLAFGGSKLLWLVSAPEAWAETLQCAVFSVALGAFLLALYVSSKNLLLPILVHFLFHIAEFAPLRCSTAPRVLGEDGSLLMLATASVVLVVLAVWLFRRNDRRLAAEAKAQ